MANRYKPESIRPTFEFTKIVIAGVLILYYLTAIFSFVIILIMMSKGEYMYCIDGYKAMLAFIEIPIPIAIGFYCWKARGENIPKQYQRMLNDITDPQLKAIFLSSIASGNLANLDLTKNRMGKQYNDMVVDEEESVIGSCHKSTYTPTDYGYTEESVEEAIIDE